MQIIALQIISMSELVKVMPELDYDWIENNKQQFDKILYEVGMDINYPIDHQENIQHRNRFNEVVQCSRWVGNERIDSQWIESGYASEAATDKSRNSKLTIDLYRLKGMAE